MNSRKKNQRLTLLLVLGVLFMFGFCYMLIPLYELVCKKEGINGGSVRAASTMENIQIDRSRVIKVDFSTVLHNNLGFKFLPLQQHIEIHPGEKKLIYFYAENNTGKEMIVQAIPSVTPMDAARYLKKTECFCFTQQYFFKDEKADMPVYFFVSPDVPDKIKEITLSYTLFDATHVAKKGVSLNKGRIDL